MRNGRRIAAALLVALCAFAARTEGQLADEKVLTLEQARRMVAAAEAEAERRHLRGVVAVVDDGGRPILIERMDDAPFGANPDMDGPVPIVFHGRVIGWIGASFDPPEHDAEIARAGLAAFSAEPSFDTKATR